MSRTAKMDEHANIRPPMISHADSLHTSKGSGPVGRLLTAMADGMAAMRFLVCQHERSNHAFRPMK